MENVIIEKEIEIKEEIKINLRKVEIQMKGEMLSSNFSTKETKILYKIYENGEIDNLNICYKKFDRRFGNVFLTFESTNEKTISENIREFNLIIKSKKEKKAIRRRKERMENANSIVRNFNRTRFGFLYYEKLKKEEHQDLKLKNFMNEEFSKLLNLNEEELEIEVQKNLNTTAA